MSVHVVHTGRLGSRPALSTGRPGGWPGSVQACFNAVLTPFNFRSLWYLPLSPLFLHCLAKFMTFYRPNWDLVFPLHLSSNTSSLSLSSFFFFSVASFQACSPSLTLKCLCTYCHVNVSSKLHEKLILWLPLRMPSQSWAQYEQSNNKLPTRIWKKRTNILNNRWRDRMLHPYWRRYEQQI